MVRELLGRPRLPVAVVAAGLASVLAAGSVAAVELGAGSRSDRGVAVALERDLPDAADVPGRADRERRARAGLPAPQPSAAPEVAPLGELRTPDVVVRSGAPLAPEVVAALRGIDGVVAAALLDAGTVGLSGGQSRLLGVDPAEFRAFTPQETAASDALWQAVARGDLAVSYALAQERSLPLGGDVVVAERAGRIGAVAAFGLPGAEVVASRATARQLGAVADAVLVLSAPQVKTAALQRAVVKVAGAGVEVELLRPPDVAPSKLKGKPTTWRDLYIDSTRYCPGLAWQVLAAIGQVESAHGQHLGPSSAGALGPMQFMPATWAAYGIDGDGDGVADIMNPLDAVPSAARYLCRNGATRGEQGLYNAVFAYNHADWYVQKVLALAAQYE